MIMVAKKPAKRCHDFKFLVIHFLFEYVILISFAITHQKVDLFTNNLLKVLIIRVVVNLGRFYQTKNPFILKGSIIAF